MIRRCAVVVSLLMGVGWGAAQAGGLAFVPKHVAWEAPEESGAAALLTDVFAPADVFVTPWRQAFYVNERATKPELAAGLLGLEVVGVVEWDGHKQVLSVTLVPRRGQRPAPVTASGEGPLIALKALIPELRGVLATKLKLGVPRPPATASQDAFAAYAQGVAALARPAGAAQAEPGFARALSSDPHFAPAAHELGTALWDLGRRQEAAEAYRRALAARPNSAMTHNNLAVVLMRKHDLAAARTEIDAALAAVSDPAAVAYAHVSLGNLYRLENQLGKARAEYERARALMPKHPAPLLNLAVLELKQHDPIAAEGWLRRLTALDTDRRATADAYRLLGDLQLKLGHFTQAVVEYRRALEVRPDYAFAYSNLGVAYRKLNQPRQAVQCYQRAIELNNDKKALAAAHNNWGNLLRKQGRSAEAAEHFREALKHDPDNVTIRNNLRTVTP